MCMLLNLRLMFFHVKKCIEKACIFFFENKLSNQQKNVGQIPSTWAKFYYWKGLKQTLVYLGLQW
jgi:hypothetical protein